jgi:hypothetical protein
MVVAMLANLVVAQTEPNKTDNPMPWISPIRWAEKAMEKCAFDTWPTVAKDCLRQDSVKHRCEPCALRQLHIFCARLASNDSSCPDLLALMCAADVEMGTVGEWCACESFAEFPRLEPLLCVDANRTVEVDVNCGPSRTKIESASLCRRGADSNETFFVDCKPKNLSGKQLRKRCFGPAPPESPPPTQTESTSESEKHLQFQWFHFVFVVLGAVMAAL